VEIVQVPDEDALELRAIAVAAGGLPLARLGEDAGGHGQVAQRRRGDGFGLIEVGLVAGDLVQHGEPADDHALVVGPGRSAVVRAVRGQAVVDQADRADHAAGLEPPPFAQRPVEVIAGRALMETTLMETTLMKAARDEQKQLVRDRVLVSLPAGPPQAAATRVVPAVRHPGEQPARHIEILHLAGQVVRRDPGQRPPAVVVVIQVAETRVGPLGPGERRLDDGPVCVLTGPLAVLDHGGQRVGRVPPARGLPQPGPRVVPALQRADGFAGPGPVLFRLLGRRHGYGVGAGPAGAPG